LCSDFGKTSLQTAKFDVNADRDVALTTEKLFFHPTMGFPATASFTPKPPPLAETTRRYPKLSLP
jgi:hypothetical protein